MVVFLHQEDLQDYEAGKLVLHRIKETFRQLVVVFGDSAYGKCGLPEGVRRRVA